MAPSAAATKKKKTVVAAKRKSTSIKKSTSSSGRTAKATSAKAKAKPKPKRSATSSLSNRKRKQPPPAQPAVTVLPSDWPVASQPPRFPPDASALRPGSLLQQVCSGQDIQLARAACVAPNFEKEKGKFLLVFPGNFSFGNGADASGKCQRPQLGKAAAERQTDGDEDRKPSAPKEQDQGTAKSVVTATTKTTTSTCSSPSAATTMGRIEGLRTNTPAFRIPFPHLQKSLVFPGKKIATTSKFLALSCSNKKSGTVQCKNIFSSAVVFGIPKWESSDENENVISTPIGTATTDTTKSAVAAIVSSSLEEDKNVKTNQNTENDDDVDVDVDADVDADNDENIRHPFLHYGGSERTVDGATRSSRKASSNKTTSDSGKSTSIKERVPIWSNYGSSSSNNNNNNNPSCAFDFSNVSKPEAKKATAAETKTATSYDISSDDEEKHSDSKDDYDAKLCTSNDLPLSATKTRLPPRRKASMMKKRYVEEEEESNDDTDRSDSDDDGDAKNQSDEEKKPLATRGGTIATTSSKKQQQKRSAGKATNTKIGTKRKPLAKKEVIDVDDQNDDDDSSSDISEAYDQALSRSDTYRRNAPRRKSRSNSKTNYKELNESDIDKSDGDDYAEKENASNDSSDDKASVAKKPRRAKSTKKSKKESPSQSATVLDYSKLVAAKTPSSKRKVATSRSKSILATPTQTSGKKRQRNEPLAKKNVSVLVSASTPSPGAKSPFRRRHKKKSPVKKARSQVLDLTKDDEFTFG